MYNLMWFRADLRLADNPALSAAMADGPVIAVYTLCQQTWQEHDLSPAKISLIVESLKTLADALGKKNIPLLIIDCNTFDKVPAQLAELSEKFSAKALYFNHEFEINERRLSKAVSTRLQKQLSVQGFNDQCALAPGTVKTANHDWYQVFTPFRKKYLQLYPHQARALYPIPDAQAPIAVNTDLRALGKVPLDPRWQALWPPGEAEAAQRLSRFTAQGLDDYHLNRDLPALPGTSVLSPYLAIGAVSTRQCIEIALRHGGAQMDDKSTQGAQTWLTELIWREFYRHLIYAFPHLCMHKAFQQKTERLPWSHQPALFEAWKTGKTGFPIVDAAMKQLRDTGWMHNRLRMITAMFLTKHLFIDWRLGEQYFMNTLVDGDLASNNGGWQWSASTGVDAAPYFRIFNPVRQSERFDARGNFIRRYLPQLASLSDKAIHMPSPLEAESCSYPLAIVDHKTAVTQTKAAFKNL